MPATFPSSKPSEKQVKDLEIAHKDQYLNLVTANHLWLNLFSKVKGKPKDSKEYKALYALGNNIAKNAGKWYARQWKFEQKGKIPPVSKDIMKYFLQPANEIKLLALAKSYLGKEIKLSGMGFIPLLIWGVIILIAAFTAYEITDELNTTAEEKKDLLLQTQKSLQELNVSGPEAAAIISSTQAQASASGGGLFGGGFKILLLAGIALFALNFAKSKQKQTTTSHG